MSEAPIGWMIERLVTHTYEGGLHGTCYECPFASVPLRSDGTEAEWREVSNDPTEAHFRCSLPGRDPSVVAWGEYGPCTEQEWLAVIQSRLFDLRSSDLDLARRLHEIPAQVADEWEHQSGVTVARQVADIITARMLAVEAEQ